MPQPLELSTPDAILFDLDDTILTSHSGDPKQLWLQSVVKYIDRFDSLTTQELFLEIGRVAGEFWSDPERHRKGRLQIKLSRQQIASKAAQNLNCRNDEAAFELAAHYHDTREQGVIPFVGALETLQHFKTSQVKTALITNGSSEVQRLKINKFGLERYFDHVLVEGEFGAGKPEPLVYQHLMEKLLTEPENTWIVGDNLEWEVRVPGQLGMVTFWNDFMKTGLPEGSPTPHRIIHSIHELIDLTKF